jgi:hypothetical protein
MRQFRRSITDRTARSGKIGCRFEIRLRTRHVSGFVDSHRPEFDARQIELQSGEFHIEVGNQICELSVLDFLVHGLQSLQNLDRGNHGIHDVSQCVLLVA